ncbi:hypothetical protein TA3x_005631 [Tundrisphaera sp. TA3]|uniref:hypothetical protein n=1 Tax=Tundrisphaera sp. TA3 TaxID=3435775 RepID=UPI003EBC6E7D
MSHHHARGATSREVGIIARLTTAGSRAVDPSDRMAIGEGLELIRLLVSERGRRRDLDVQWDEAGADGFPVDPPCPD